jgi:hypothetical protein
VPAASCGCSCSCGFIAGCGLRAACELSNKQQEVYTAAAERELDHPPRP